MKNWENILIVIASTGLISLVPAVAIAGSSTSVTLEQKVQEKVEMKLAADGRKYSRIVSLAGDRQDELTKRENDAISAYNKWHGLIHAVVSHYPSNEDFRAIEAAAKAYSHANKAFIDLQKSVLAQNRSQLDTVATTTLIAIAQTGTNSK